MKYPGSVIPAQAGIQFWPVCVMVLDSRLRGNDGISFRYQIFIKRLVSRTDLLALLNNRVSINFIHDFGDRFVISNSFGDFGSN